MLHLTRCVEDSTPHLANCAKTNLSTSSSGHTDHSPGHTAGHTAAAPADSVRQRNHSASVDYQIAYLETEASGKGQTSSS